MNEQLKELLELYSTYDLSDGIIDRIKELLDTMFEDETDVCPHCGRLFLKSENALEYEQSNGEYTCECLSPANQAADISDMLADDHKNNRSE